MDDAVARLREDRALVETPVWQVNNYPASGPVGLVEFLLEPTEELTEPEEAVPGIEEMEETLQKEN